MLEKEFAERYRASQENTHAPAGLIESTRTLVAYAQETETTNDEGTMHGSSSQKSSESSESRRTQPVTSKPPKRRSRYPRWMMPVAACLAALLVLFGVGSAMLPAGLPFMQEQAPIRAYAKTPNLLTAELDDGIVPFAIDTQTAFQGYADWHDEEGANAEGSYTGMQFTIEGEGIKSVQATIDRGELYRVTTQFVDGTTDEGREMLREEAGWKPTARGTGKYFRDYDYVTRSLNRNDPAEQTQLRLIKRLGSTINVAYDDEPLTFGLWFEGGFERRTDLYPDLSSLDDTKLTITATYNNGTSRTQTMTLHDGWFTVLPAGNQTQQGQSGADQVMAEGPFKTEPSRKFDPDRIGKKSVYTLYGEVTSITDQPHPYPLDNANEHANAPVERMPLFDEPSFTPSTGTTAFEETPDSDKIHTIDGDSDLAIGQWSYERNDWADLHWSDISAYITDTLPTSIDLYQNTEVWAFTGNIEYMNICRLQTDHWSIDEQGHVNGGNSFVVLDVTVTNAEDEEVMFSGREVRGTMCAVDEETGTTLFADGGLFGAADELGRTWGHGVEDSFRLGPHESIRLHIAFIADDRIAQADEVLFTLTSLAELEPYHGKSRTSFDEVEFFSLGKLERR